MHPEQTTSPVLTTGRIGGAAINDVIGSVLDNVGTSQKERQSILRGIIGYKDHVEGGETSWKGAASNTPSM